MAKLYGPHLARIWTEALLLPGHTDLYGSLAAELAHYYQIGQGEAAAQMADAWNVRKEQQLSAFPRDVDAARLNDYYSNHEHGVYNSMFWHSLRGNAWALHSVAGLHLVQQMTEGHEVFEFGHGVGSTGLLFAKHGFTMTLGDISADYRNFARSRFESRAMQARFLDLTQGDPPENAFDAVISFDVLEHIPDPLTELAKLWKCLRDGGVMVLNIAFGRDPENPEHLLHRRRGILDKIRQLGFERVQAPSLLAYYKQPLGLWKPPIYRVQDWVDAAGLDLAARHPRVRRLFTPYQAPPV